MKKLREDVCCSYLINDDGRSGKQINKNTGEVFDVEYAVLRAGDRILTKEEIARIEKYRKIKLRREEREAEQKKRRKGRDGKAIQFTGVSTSADFSDLSPASVTRLIYLSTYLSFHNGELRLSERRKITKGMLPDILRVGERTAERFLQEVSPKYVIIANDGCLSLNPDVFAKGNRMRSLMAFYIKVFQSGMQKLYNGVNKSQHKQLGYIFNMLPYVNIEHNILCHNTTERDISLIEPMTMSEFCAEIGYDYKNVQRLHDIFKHLKFDVGDGKRELFCSIIRNEYTGKELMVINPKVFYSGSNAKAVAEFGVFY
jgi:hypothetical protein